MRTLLMLHALNLLKCKHVYLINISDKIIGLETLFKKKKKKCTLNPVK